jgi:asparagine N-glycosylation enzyme membrane subunit Stt3
VRLTRVTDLYETGDWYHPAPMKSNTPYGDISHWTRPFDVLLLAGAVPLSKWMGFEAALFWWGVTVSPILLALTLIVLNWTTKAILSRDGTFLVILLFLSQTVLLSYYQPARPDHHGLLVLLFVISVGLALRLVLEPFKYSICYAAGAVGALSLWVSVESMIPVCLSLGVLGLLWIMNQGDYLRKAVHLGIALFIFCSINLLLERPFSDIMSIEFDRLSIVYSCLFGLIALFWVVASVFESRTPLLRNRTGRIVCCVLGGLGVALAMRLLFPAFYKGPMADVDPRIIPILFNKIKEVQPLMSNSSFLGMAVQVIGSAVVSFILLVYLFLQNAEKAKRSGWVCIAVLAVAFVSIALYQLRWAVYAQTLLCIVMTELLCRILQWRKDQGNKLMRALRNGLVTMVFAFGFLYVGVITKTLVKKDEPKENREKISLIPMCEYLNEQDRTLRILTHSNFAGEILYRTPHEVVGANYHRNGPGIIDAHKTMTAETDAEALNLIRQRGLDVVLICPASIESVFRSESEDVSTFYQRLQDDLPPDGLKKAPLPGNLAENFLMFEIDL